MIRYAFLAVGCTGLAGVVLVVAAWRAQTGSGIRRLTLNRRELRHELRDARHQLDGAGRYIGHLERDLRATAADREWLIVRFNDAHAALEKQRLRIADLEDQLHGMDQLREANTALKAELANTRAIRPLPPHGDTPPGARIIPVPLHQAPFATSPRESAS